jgi:hypothetical protein
MNEAASTSRVSQLLGELEATLERGVMSGSLLGHGLAPLRAKFSRPRPRAEVLAIVDGMEEVAHGLLELARAGLDVTAVCGELEDLARRLQVGAESSAACRKRATAKFLGADASARQGPFDATATSGMSLLALRSGSVES